DAAGRPTFGIRSDACSYPFPPGKTARGTDFGPLQPHPFAEETRTLLKALACGRSHIRYSSSDPEDQPGVDFDAAGRLNLRVLQEPGVPRNGLHLWTANLHERSDRRLCSLERRSKPHPNRDFRHGSVNYPGSRRFAALATVL